MTEAERDKLGQRWHEIERELAELYEGKVQTGNPVTREGELLAEQDEIEFAMGEDWQRSG